LTKVNDLHRKWMKKNEYREAFEDLAPEFALARAVIDAAVTAGLAQEQLAQRMDTTQSVIARMESGRTRPTRASAAGQGSCPTSQSAGDKITSGTNWHGVLV
jgi:ribosome-binding protein aMBF1 (putative translation factor)